MGYSGASGALDELLNNLVCRVVAVPTIVTKKVAGQKALKIERGNILINIYKKRGVYAFLWVCVFLVMHCRCVPW